MLYSADKQEKYSAQQKNDKFTTKLATYKHILAFYSKKILKWLKSEERSFSFFIGGLVCVSNIYGRF